MQDSWIVRWLKRGEGQKFDPDQPRIPAGSSEGGQWASSGGGEPDMEPFKALPGESEIDRRNRAKTYYETLISRAKLKPLPKNRFLKPNERVFVMPIEGSPDPNNRFGTVNAVRGYNNPRGKNPLEKEPWIMVNTDSLFAPPFNGRQGANGYLPGRLMLFDGWKEE